MHIQDALTAIGFKPESLGPMNHLVLRGATHTWVASDMNGAELPDDDDWLICEYTNAAWANGGDDERSFDAGWVALADIVAMIKGA